MSTLFILVVLAIVGLITIAVRASLSPEAQAAHRERELAARRDRAIETNRAVIEARRRARAAAMSGRNPSAAG